MVSGFQQKWYYYDENAKSVSGSVTIGKDTYQFDTEGVLYTNSVMYQGVGIDLYKLTDGNGKLVELQVGSMQLVIGIMY